MAYSVAVYLVDLAYGGAEEGGWYYSCGIPSDEHVEFTRGFADEDSAYAYARELNQNHGDDWNRGRASINSVLSQGAYYAEVREGNPSPYPKERPYYE